MQHQVTDLETFVFETFVKRSVLYCEIPIPSQHNEYKTNNMLHMLHFLHAPYHNMVWFLTLCVE